MPVISLLLKLIVTSISLFIISKLPIIGVEIDSFGKAVFSAFVFGILNAIAWPLMALFKLGGPFGWPIIFVLNIIIFALAAALVPGFRLKNKLLDPVAGALLLTIFNNAINHFLPFSG